MKYDSLGWHEAQALEKIYDERHADDKPDKPEEFEPPQQASRRTIEVENGTDVYVRLKTSGYKSEMSAKGELRLVGGQEHIRIGLDDVRAIDELILELRRLRDDISTYNAKARAYRQREKEYNDAMEAYKHKREQDLRNALKSGKFTKDDIVARTDDIPF